MILQTDHLLNKKYVVDLLTNIEWGKIDQIPA